MSSQNKSVKKKTVILLSGGLDSAVALSLATQVYDCYALSFDYGQRHKVELERACLLAEKFKVCEHKIFSLDLRAFGGSALTDNSIDVPEGGSTGIPITYVPARNTIFLAIALAYAEVRGAADIFIGVNAVDYSGYPDCRPEYIKAFTKMANLATRNTDAGGQKITIHTPLLKLSKAQIIRKGHENGVDFGLTVSCYNADKTGRACGKCDSCMLRQKGFIEADLTDPTVYYSGK